jgi:hypothetical protein
MTAALVAGTAAAAGPALAWSWDPTVQYRGTLPCLPSRASDLVVTGAPHGSVTVSGTSRTYGVTFTGVPSRGAQVTFALHCGGGDVVSVGHHVTRPFFGRSVRFNLTR